jgi:hypothetical protein
MQIAQLDRSAILVSLVAHVSTFEARSAASHAGEFRNITEIQQPGRRAGGRAGGRGRTCLVLVSGSTITAHVQSGCGQNRAHGSLSRAWKRRRSRNVASESESRYLSSSCRHSDVMRARAAI